MSNSVTLVIDNSNTGDYTARIFVGSENTPCDVILDTGSSTLALDEKAYNPNSDQNAQGTGLYQFAEYGSGSWSGIVVNTDVSLSDSQDSSSLKGVSLASAFKNKNMFSGCDGILGLAYRELNNGLYKLDSKGKNLVQSSDTLQPYFTQLEESGVVANKFSFYTLRSVPSAKKPALNKGLLILGDGEGHGDLHHGDFQTAKVTHDEYYNVNLKSIKVGDQANIDVPPAQDVDAPNCIVDSGTNGIVFPTSAYHDVINQFYKVNPHFGELISMALKNNNQISQDKLNLKDWPSITFNLEGDNGDATLVMAAETYWQCDTGDNMASLRFFGADATSILGLPLMNNYFCVFDRSADDGVGKIKFASIKQ